MYYDGIETARKTMMFFFIVDKSGSMSGDKIGTLNYAIKEVIPNIQKISEKNTNAKINMAALAFSDDVEWVTPSPVPIENFIWRDIGVKDRGGTNFGAMCNELCKILNYTKGGFMLAPGLSVAPVIMLLSDGQPTDKNFEECLDSLNNNDWFKIAIKIAIAIGKDADLGVLTKFTNDERKVLNAHNMEQLKKMIEFVSLKIPDIGSDPRNTLEGNNNIQEKVGKALSEAKDNQRFGSDKADFDPINYD